MLTEAALSSLRSALSAHGLMLRGGFNFLPEDKAPPGPSGKPARAVLLIGNAGQAMWPNFTAWLDRQPDVMADPLDCWSAEVIDAAAGRAGARAVYPNDRPFLPFQRWAMRAEGLKPSPLGILMHPDHGLWHAYRGALLFDDEIAIQAPQKLIHLCDTCAEKPCLSACPVGAFSDAGYDVPACAAHVVSADGQACRSQGCLSRKACPIGEDWRYSPAQQAFHQAAFLGSQLTAGRAKSTLESGA